jgi:undecaprenyl-diphosphatase
METLLAFDHGVMDRLAALHRPWLTEFMKFMTFVGDTIVLPTFAVAACLAFVAFRQYRAAAILAAASLAGLLLSETAKDLVKRKRPDNLHWRLVELPDSPSFPSGHSLNSMNIYTAAGLLTARRLRRRWVGGVLVALAVGLSVLIGLSRSYLGVHWPTDVIGGWSAGLAFALLTFWVDRRFSARLRPETGPKG